MLQEPMPTQGGPRVRQVNLKLDAAEEDAIIFLSAFHDRSKGEVVRRYLAMDELMEAARELREGVSRIGQAIAS